LGEFFVISDEFEKKLHPEARKLIHEWIADVQRQVQLDEVNNDDLKFLSAADIIKLKRIYEVSECLNKCKDIKDGDKLYDVYFGDIFFSKGVISQLKRDLLNIEFDIVPPLKKICEGRVAKAKEEERKRAEEEKRKAEKAEEEQRKREEEERLQAEKVKEEQRRREEAAEAEERWWAAYKALNIPADDAFKYLKPDKHEEFVDSILGAVDAYLVKGKFYILDRRANDYLAWISIINNRRKKEQEKITANLAAQEYNQRLNKEIVRLKSVLWPSEKDLNAWFEKKIRDKRYTGHNFDYILSPEEKDSFDGTLVSIANKKLEQLIPNDLRQFIDIPSQYYRIYFPLPSTNYSFEGIACLDFCFDIFATAYAEIWLKPVHKTFSGYAFSLPVMEGGNGSAPLEKPKFLGYYYLVLTPKDLGGYVPWQSIPLALLRGLLNGETKPNGTTISAVSDGMIIYKIPKCKEEVTIPDSFAGYLRSIGSIDEMVSMGIMTDKIADIVKSESGELEVEQKTSLSEEKGRDSKKARAFQLFSQGKRPSDSEVKTLGIKPESTYRYYQQWKKLVIVGNNRI